MTKVVRFSPRADLFRMQRDFDNMFSNFFPGLSSDDNGEAPVTWHPRIDVVETPDAYELALDVPGCEEVLSQMLAQTERLGFKDRGILAPGYAGDLTIFDLDELAWENEYFVDDLPSGGARLRQPG